MLAVVALVTACGGGGGSGPQTDGSSEPPVVVPTCIQTVEGCLEPERYEARLQSLEDGHGQWDSFNVQWGLAAIRAGRAYAQLELEHGIDIEPGAGQTVGLIDSGIDQNHPAFDETDVAEVFLGSAQDETGVSSSHGTAVASVIAARRDVTLVGGGSGAHGVAWGADIVMFAIPTASGGGPYDPIAITAQTGVDDAWASRLQEILGWSRDERTLDFINVSVGYNGIIEQYSEQDLRSSFPESIPLVAQSDEADKTIFVWSAGNGHGKPCDAADFANNPDLCVDGLVNARSVEVLPGLPVRIPELRENIIAVVAVAPDSDGDGDYEIAEFSNRCGIAKEWCIAAPGEDIRVAYFGPHNNRPGFRGSALLNGTSFAAPMVTGALAVMKHYFRDELLNTALAARLLATADKSGIYADADVYGHGLLDLAAATSPQGTPRVSLGTLVEEGGVALDLTRLSLGGALGDGLTQSLAGQEVAAFDALDAPFWYALDSLTNAAPVPWAGARLRHFMAQPEADRESRSWRPALGAMQTANGAERKGPLRLDMLEAPSVGADAGHLALAGRAVALRSAGPGSLDVAAFSTEGLDGLPPVTGATLAWRPAGSPLGLRGGWVGEREAMLGSVAGGAFGRLAAGSTFVGIDGSAALGAWRLGAGAEVGTVDGAGHGGMIADVSPLTTSAFGLRAERPLAGAGTLTLSLSQPLRVEAGRAYVSPFRWAARRTASCAGTRCRPISRPRAARSRWRPSGRRRCPRAASCASAPPGPAIPATPPGQSPT